jgi:hypothetical protein
MRDVLGRSHWYKGERTHGATRGRGCGKSGTGGSRRVLRLLTPLVYDDRFYGESTLAGMCLNLRRVGLQPPLAIRVRPFPYISTAPLT